MSDTVSGSFITLIGHSTLVVSVMFQPDGFLLSQLPPAIDVIPETTRVQFTVVLALTLFLCFLELAFISRSIPSVAVALTSTCLHLFACLMTVYFIIDVHPCTHFYPLLVPTAIPVLIHVVLFLSSYTLRTIFCQ